MLTDDVSCMRLCNRAKTTASTSTAGPTTRLTPSSKTAPSYARQATNRQREVDAGEIWFRFERRVDELTAAERETVGLASRSVEGSAGLGYQTPWSRLSSAA